MSTTATHALFGLASTVTDPATGLSGPKGVPGTRKSLPLAGVEYAIAVAMDTPGSEVIVDLADGTATGAATAVAASGSITISGSVPVAEQTIEVNGTTYTFKALAALETEITIGADAAETVANAVAVIASYDPLVAVTDTGAITIASAVTGVAGNAITLSAAADYTAASGATLTGGVDGVVVAGAGVDSLGVALPVMGKVHGLLVQVTSGRLLVSVAGVLREIVDPDGGAQLWSAPGRFDLVADMRLVAAEYGTAATVTIRASE